MRIMRYVRRPRGARKRKYLGGSFRPSLGPLLLVLFFGSDEGRERILGEKRYEQVQFTKKHVASSKYVPDVNGKERYLTVSSSHATCFLKSSVARL